jgi:hypothetical protein
LLTTDRIASAIAFAQTRKRRDHCRLCGESLLADPVDSRALLRQTSDSDRPSALAGSARSASSCACSRPSHCGAAARGKGKSAPTSTRLLLLGKRSRRPWMGRTPAPSRMQSRSRRQRRFPGRPLPDNPGHAGPFAASPRNRAARRERGDRDRDESLALPTQNKSALAAPSVPREPSAAEARPLVCRRRTRSPAAEPTIPFAAKRSSATAGRARAFSEKDSSATTESALLAR